MLMRKVLELIEIDQRIGIKMSENETLVAVTASRKNGELVYKVECSNTLTNEEFEYYLGELIKGICEWKHDICKENIRSYKGTIKEMKSNIQKKGSTTRKRTTLLH